MNIESMTDEYFLIQGLNNLIIRKDLGLKQSTYIKVYEFIMIFFFKGQDNSLLAVARAGTHYFENP